MREEDALRYLLRLYVNYLRQRIEPDPANQRYVLTEHGAGHRFINYRRAGAEARGTGACGTEENRIG
ncbi:MAG: hypothetical protein ACYC5O_24100 [Anaerolineae bacterium]